MGVADEMVSLQDIFVFDRLGVAPNGKILGRFRATGVRPAFYDRLKASGINLPTSLFEHSQEA
jgi:pilus assembly protein CpaF